MKVTEETVCVFETWSGSRYEINKGRVRRLNPSAEKRGDGEWHQLYILPELWIGAPANLVMESLSKYGEDDYGNVGDLTTRTTSDIIGIEMMSDPEEVPF